MKQSTKFFAAVCILLASVSVSLGRGRGHGHTEPPKVPYMAISSVNPTAMTITIEPKNSTATGSKTYHFTAATRITVNGHDATVSDLQPGLQIRVGTGSDGVTADSLSASAPPAERKK